MTTTMQLLSMQHQDVLARLTAVEAVLGDADDRLLTAFASYLEGEVVHHFGLEEQALFPVLARHLSSTQGPLAVMHAEHAEFRELLNSLRSGGSAGQRTYARSVIDLLRAHIAKEDHVLFPMAERLLSAEEKNEVERRAALASDAAGLQRD